MSMMSLEEIQRNELETLIELIRFFDENGIKYSMGGGSLIGAIRHEGFIPWDDDIDIFLVREEFDKFISAAKENDYKISDNHKLLIPGESEDYYYTFPKVVDTRTIVHETLKAPIADLGLWIDIFPIDYCSNSELDANEFVKEHMSLMLKYYKFLLKYPNDYFGGIVRNAYLFLYKRINRSVPKAIAERCGALAHNKKMNYSGTLAWCFSPNDIYPTSWFEEYTFKKFGGQKVMVFKEYDKILTHRFGDYMRIPSESERNHHDLNAEWRNKV